MTTNAAPSMLKCHRRRLRAALLVSCSLGGAALFSVPAAANPEGGSVQAGSATIGGEGTANVRIDQSTQKAIIDWRSFSIGANESTLFNVPNAQSVTLNRVSGESASSILGRLQSNGQLFLINPNGILFGKSARVDVAGIVATTADISNQDFMSGTLRFGTAGKKNASVVNDGLISVRDAGVAAFVAPRVRNSGIIQARLGKIALGAGERFTLDLAGDNLVRFEVGDEVTDSFTNADGSSNGALLESSGLLDAQGGSVLLTASAARQVINQSVRVSAPQASSLAVENGVVKLKANAPANVVTAKSVNIRASGEVEIAADAAMDLSGVNGGTLDVRARSLFLDGAINLTGSQTGGRVNASATDWMSVGGLVDASGTKAGGQISLDSGGDLSFAGTLVADSSLGKGGTVSLHSGGGSLATSSGIIDASGLYGGAISHIADGGLLSSAIYRAAGTVGKGGTIDLTGKEIGLLSAKLYAYGGIQGGRVRVGGEYQGGKGLATDELANATSLTVNDGVVTDVSAKMAHGNGGQAVFWSNQRTTFLGSIDMRGGQTGGSGGFAEVSSGDQLAWDGKVESAGNGQRGGNLLLDPKNITIATVLGDPSLKLTIDSTSAYFAGQTVGNIGRSMSLDGNRLALGISSHSIDTPQVTGTGSVFLITFSDSNFSNATLQGVIGRGFTGGKNINMPNLKSLEGLGSSVSLFGTQLAVGASRGTGLNDLQPGAYLFSFTDNAFSGGIQRVHFGRGLTGAGTVDTTAFGHLDDMFGASIALGNGVLAIGAPTDVGTTGQTAQQYGAVHLFTFSGNDFSNLTRVGSMGSGYTGGSSLDIASSTVGLNSNASLFGTSLALDGRVLAVGVPVKDGGANAYASSGAVFLYQFTNDSFGGPSQILKIERGATGAGTYDATNVDIGDQFGTSVAMRNGILAVGAVFDDGSGVAGTVAAGNDYGAVHLFTLNSDSTGITSTKVLGRGYANNMSTLASDARFGTSVSLGDGTLGVGAKVGTTTQGVNSGTAYFFNSGSGAAIANPLSYSNDPSGSSTISPFSITSILNAGTSVTLQANNDINVNMAINANNPNGNGGALTLQAGRSIFVNAGITSANGNVNLIANDFVSNGVQTAYRDAGTGSIQFGNAGFINAGTGAVKLEVRDGTWSGDISVGNITAGSVELLNNGANPGSVTIQAGKQITASGSGNAIVVSGKSFYNLAGSSAFNLTGGGRYLVYSQNWTAGNFTRGGLGGGNLYNRTYSNAAPGTIGQSGSQFIFSAQPTLTVTANNDTRIYGDANPAFGYSVSGLVNGDTQSAAFSGAPSLSTHAVQTSGVGTYAITPAAGSMASSIGYAFAFAPGTLTISKAMLTVTADNASRTYGDANPTLTGTITGFKNGEGTGNLTGAPTYTTVATSASNVGTYTITASGGTAANYNFSYTPGTLTIGKAMLTVTADNASRQYGVANPTFTGSITGFKNGQTASVLGAQPTYSSVAGTSANVGTYQIIGSGASATNYSFDYVPGTLTITRAMLTVTANNATRKYGAADPTYSSTISGLLGTDTTSVVTNLAYSTSATATSGVGTYALNVSGGTATNYNFTYVPGTLTITKAMLTVTANNDSRTYGDANPTFSGTISGFVNGENSQVLTGTPTYSTVATSASNAGTYTITASGGTADNYDFNYVPGTLTVNKAVLTVTADNTSREYGDANPAFTGSITGFKNGQNASDLLAGPTYSTAATSTDNAGTYDIVGAGGNATNYSFNYVPGTLTITKALLTVTAGNASREYGLANPTFTGIITGFKNGDTASAIDTGPVYGTVAGLSSGAGTYTITASGASDDNYNFAYLPGTLTVTKAMLTVTADNTSRQYGAANPAFTSTISGLRAGDTAQNIGTLSYNTSATAASGTGTYQIDVSGGSSANYNFTYAPGTLTIGKAMLTVTANNGTKVYGTANPTFSGTITGFVNGDTANTALTTAPVYATAATTGSGVGTYQITASGAAADNYSFTYVPGTLTITKAMLTVTANDATRTYGDSNPAFSGTITGFVNGDTALSLANGPTYSTTATVNSNVGTYQIIGSGASSTNYDFTYNPGTLTITKAMLTVTADNASRQYGLANPTFTGTISGFKNGQTASVINTGPTYSTTAGVGSDVGTYTIAAGGAADDNYSFTYVPGTLTITKAMLTVTANDDSRIYGNANPLFTSTITGLRAGDSSTVVTGLSYSTSASSLSDVGTYAINVTGGMADNYDFTYVPGSLTVTKAMLTVTAGNASRTYGDSNPAFTGTISGFKNGQDSSALTSGPIYSTVATSAADVGSYTITAGGAAATNYDFTYVPGTLTIGKAMLTVTADSTSRQYGLANPTFTGTITGFKNGQTASVIDTGPVYSSVAAVGSGVGSYAITASGASDNNYIFSYLPGTLTITKAMLTVAANDASRTYGDSNPSFTSTITGLRAGDSSNVVSGLAYSTAATNLSGVGTYAINATGGMADNYDFTYVPGSLTVTKAMLTVTAGDASRIYGDANPSLTGTIAGFRNGDIAASALTAAPVFATGATAASGVGTYQITASGAAANNYDFTYLPGTLTITKAMLTVTADNATREYGLANPLFGGVVTGFKNGDATSVVSGLTYGTRAGVGSNVGTYQIVGSGAQSANYDFTYVPGTLTITKAMLTVAADDASRTYGSGNPAFSGTITGLRAGDSSNVVSGLTYSTAATTASNVGSYAINASGGSATNYDFTYAPGSLTVTKAMLTVTPDSYSRFYGQPNPTLTASFIGFMNGDTGNVVSGLQLSTAAGPTSLMGNYDINASGATATNYDFTYRTGTLKVQGAPIPDYIDRPNNALPPNAEGHGRRTSFGEDAQAFAEGTEKEAKGLLSRDSGYQGANVRVTTPTAYVGHSSPTLH